MQKNEFKEFEKKIKYRFKNKKLLKHALIHRSFKFEKNIKTNTIINNERLEFLGDSILGAVITIYLYNELPQKAEGELARMKSIIVGEQMLYKISQNIEVPKYLILGKGEEGCGGREKPSILGDAIEAIIGAIYLDSNINSAKKFILFHFNDVINNVINNLIVLDYKTILQEKVHTLFKIFPSYTIIEEKGPMHSKEFKSQVKVKDIKEIGSGKTKKAAEQIAAKKILEKILKKYENKKK